MSDLAHHACEKSYICLSASLTFRPTRVRISWSMMAFSSGSNNSLISSTVFWKWVHLEHNPLVNAEYAAWGSSCAYFESNSRSFTQTSTLFSIPDSSPAHVCSVPTARMISSFRSHVIVLPMIRRKHLPIPTGLMPLSFFLSGTSLHARKVDM